VRHVRAGAHHHARRARERRPQPLGHPVEEDAAAGGHHHLLQASEGAARVERLGEYAQAVQERVDRGQRGRLAIGPQRALVALDAREHEMGGAGHRVRNRERLLVGAAAGPAGAELDEDGQRRGHAGVERGHPLDRVDQAQHLDARALAFEPRDLGRAHHLVREQHPRCAELAHDRELLHGRRGDGPGARLDLTADQRRCHRRLAVRRQREAALRAPVLHQAQVVGDRALPQHQQRERNVAEVHAVESGQLFWLLTNSIADPGLTGPSIRR
jgi:hypothetical protein